MTYLAFVEMIEAFDDIAHELSQLGLSEGLLISQARSESVS